MWRVRHRMDVHIALDGDACVSSAIRCMECHPYQWDLNVGHVVHCDQHIGVADGCQAQRAPTGWQDLGSGLGLGHLNLANITAVAT